jgi:hypothetical protein
MIRFFSFTRITIYKTILKKMNGDQVIPKLLQISESKPPACNSLIRRFFARQSPTQYNNVEQSEVTIPLDVTTASCFLDPFQTCLQFQLQVTNPNPYIDYFNLGAGGCGSFIEKMQIKSQGTTIEEIQNYAEVFENWMEVEGSNQEEFHMYLTRKNAVCSSWKGKHLNKVKMPMIDHNGKIMYACTEFNTSYPVGWQAPHLVAYAPVGGTAIAVTTSSSINYFERGWECPDGKNYYYLADGINPHLWPDTIGVEPPINTSLNQINNRVAKRTQDYFTFLANVKSIPIGCKSVYQRDSNTGVFTVGSPDTDNATTLYETTDAFSNGVFTMMVSIPLLGGIIGLQATKAFPTFICSDLSLVLTLSTCMKAASFTMDPCRRIVGTRRDYCVWYGNVLAGIYQSTYITPNLTPTGITNSYNLTIGNSNELKYGRVSQWAMMSNYMDGHAGGAISINNQNYSAANTTISTGNTTAHGLMSIDNRAAFQHVCPSLGQGVIATYAGDVGNGQSNYPSFPYGGFIAPENLDSTSSGATDNVDPVNRMTALVGTPTFSNSVTPMWTSFIQQGTVPQYFIPSRYQKSQVQTQGTPFSSSTVQVMTVAPIGQGSSALCIANSGLAYTANMLPMQQWKNYTVASGLITGSQYRGTPNIGNDAMGCFGTYLEQSQPQSKRCFNNYNKSTSSSTYITDPQISGIQYLKNFTGQGGTQSYPTFTISQVSLICHQILLPDTIAAQIAAMASQGVIKIQTKSTRTYTNIQNVSASATQNIIVPTRLAIANTAIFLFRHPEQVSTGDKQGMYHSLSGYNPFGMCSFTPDTYSFTGTVTAPSIVGMAASSATPTQNSQNWSAQLQIGAQYYPVQAITNCTELIGEVEKTNHSMFSLDHGRAMMGVIRNAAKTNLSTYTSSTQWTAVSGTLTTDVIGASGTVAAQYDYEGGSATSTWLPSGLSYSFPYCSSNTLPDATEVDILSSDTFWTVWQDPDYMLDQTIINNSQMRHLTNAQNIAEPSLNYWVPVPQGKYHVNAFVTPKSKFYLPFELDSFAGISDVTSSGTYLGQNINLLLQGAQMFLYSAGVNITCWVHCQALIMIEAGGIVKMLL